MKIIISGNGDLPIYEQIKQQIIDAIFSGKLKEGDPLPSMRQLSKNLQISLITTMRAYTDLENEGYIDNIQGKGCYVKAQNQALVREKMLYRIEEHFAEAIHLSQIAGMDLEELKNLLSVMYMDGENYSK